MVVQLAHAPLPVAPAVGAVSLAVAGAVDVPVLMQRRGCLQFFDLVDMPVIVHRHVRSLWVMSSTPCRGAEVDSYGPFS